MVDTLHISALKQPQAVLVPPISILWMVTSPLLPPPRTATLRYRVTTIVLTLDRPGRARGRLRPVLLVRLGVVEGGLVRRVDVEFVVRIFVRKKVV